MAVIYFPALAPFSHRTPIPLHYFYNRILQRDLNNGTFTQFESFDSISLHLEIGSLRELKNQSIQLSSRLNRSPHYDNFADIAIDNKNNKITKYFKIHCNNQKVLMLGIG